MIPGAATAQLPDSYNGLGFKNLVYMVVELLDLHEQWKAEEDKRASLPHESRLLRQLLGGEFDDVEDRSRCRAVLQAPGV